jgi:hypothetical protein
VLAVNGHAWQELELRRLSIGSSVMWGLLESSYGSFDTVFLVVFLAAALSTVACFGLLKRPVPGGDFAAPHCRKGLTTAW